MYGSWIYNYLWNQCLSPLMLWVRISIRARCTALHVCDKVCEWLVTGQWFSPGPPVSSTNKTDSHDITEILLKVALNTIKQTKKQAYHSETSFHGCAHDVVVQSVSVNDFRKIVVFCSSDFLYQYNGKWPQQHGFDFNFWCFNATFRAVFQLYHGDQF